MTGFWILLGDWGYALAAALFTALTLVTARRLQKTTRADTALVVALAVTALWALYAVFRSSAGGGHLIAGNIAETARNGAWLTVCWLLLRGAQDRGGVMPRGSGPLYVTLLLALGCQLCLDLILVDLTHLVRPMALFRAAWLLRAATALGAIFLLHGLYARIDRQGGNGVGWLGCALTMLWAYEFNHYLLAWLADGQVVVLGQMRGLVMSMTAPLFALGVTQRDGRRIALSRRFTYRAVLVGGGALYAFALFAMILMIRALHDPTTQIVQIGAVFALSVIVLMLLPSAPFRAWVRVEIAKHLFTHRYDYRLEWMRFADALGSEEEGDALSLRRSARAVAHAVASPAALLMLRDEDGRLLPEADWNWPNMTAPGGAIDADLAGHVHTRGWVVDFLNPADPLAPALPAWMREDSRAWALVPLIHEGQMLGAVLLARPPGRERMDWEDLDMLRVLARQLAVTLSERRHQRALAESQRFDEFNRRFAFILHDIKNMVSQMSLLAANAERHAENPAFRADMVLTLKETAGRMTDLIARLARPDAARHGDGEEGDGEECDLAMVARGAAAQARDRVTLAESGPLLVAGDAAALAQAIGHLVDNAVQATPPDGPPVRLTLSRDGETARLSISDGGCGMSAAFIRDGLFRPFASTKPNGFGFGAHEARSIIVALGGQLTVASREGAGTEFTISLPLARKRADMPLPARKTA